MKKAKITERKPRPAPVFDLAVNRLQNLKAIALAELWSPLKTRRRIAKHRKRCQVSKGPWRRAVKVVFGTGVLELPDFRQLDLFRKVE